MAEPNILEPVRLKGLSLLELICQKGSSFIETIESFVVPDYSLWSLPPIYAISSFEDLMGKRYESNNTALHMACSNNDIAAIQIICQITEKYGEDFIFQSNDNNQLPIHLAAAQGHAAAIEYLIQMQTNAEKDTWQLIAHCNNGGRHTPLHLAVINGNIEATKTLIKLAGDNALEFIFMQDQNNYTVLQWAQEGNQTEMVGDLNRSYSKPNSKRDSFKLNSTEPSAPISY